jgi:hypothetical protein
MPKIFPGNKIGTEKKKHNSKKANSGRNFEESGGGGTLAKGPNPKLCGLEEREKNNKHYYVNKIVILV